MRICTTMGFAVIALFVAHPAVADQPPKPPLVAPAAKGDNPADNAVRRGTAPPAIAARADRAQCRDQAAKMKLFGLGRHKFLQRCRRARRKAATTPPR